MSGWQQENKRKRWSKIKYMKRKKNDSASHTRRSLRTKTDTPIKRSSMKLAFAVVRQQYNTHERWYNTKLPHKNVNIHAHTSYVFVVNRTRCKTGELSTEWMAEEKHNYRNIFILTLLCLHSTVIGVVVDSTRWKPYNMRNSCWAACSTNLQWRKTTVQ